MSKEGKAAFLDMVKEGKLGFAAFHCGSDTFHSPGTVKGKPNFIRDPELDPYIQMLGGEFVIHGKHQPGTLQVTDPKFPGAPEKELHYDLEEWYSLKNFDPNLHVVMVQETQGMAGNMYMRKPYPETWARMHGKGRVFYSSLGHYEQVWSSQEFQKLMIGALNWTTGRVEADVTPNLDKAAPGAEMTVNPPAEPEKPKAAKKPKKE
jgi:hypothetical protein